MGDAPDTLSAQEDALYDLLKEFMQIVPGYKYSETEESVTLTKE